MKKLTISDAPTIILGLQDEIRRSEESRYDHRLHGILLIAQGMSCCEVARLFGDSPRTVQYWVNRFEKDGLFGLIEGERTGRPSRLSERHLKEVNKVLRQPPEASGIIGHLWDGKTLSAFIKKRFSIDLCVRQCQYLFRDLGFRLRKPRPMIARANPELQAQYKKTSTVDKK